MLILLIQLVENNSQSEKKNSKNYFDLNLMKQKIHPKIILVKIKILYKGDVDEMKFFY
jgi:hypothetical protein